MDFEFVSVKTEQVEDLIIKDEILEEEEEEEDIGVEEDGTEDSEPHVKPEIEEILVKAEPELMEEQDEPEEEFGKDSYASNSTRPVDEKADRTGTDQLPSTETKHCCRHCNESFTQERDLRDHSRIVHNDCREYIVPDFTVASDRRGAKKKFICTVCNKGYCTNKVLIDHIAMIHNGERRHCCEICGKNFSRPSLLRRHMANLSGCERLPEVQTSPLHRETERYSCNVCCRSLFTKRGLARHMLVHKGVYLRRGLLTTAALHHCPSCDKSFSQKSYLSIHMAGVHEGRKFTCPVCEEGFSGMGKLTDHMYAVHKGRTTYGCDKCSRHFSHKAFLYRHLTDVHGKMMRQKCDVCHKMLVNVKKHMSKHHPNTT